MERHITRERMISVKRAIAAGTSLALILSFGPMLTSLRAGCAERQFDEHVAPLVKDFYADSHSADEPEARFRLDGLTSAMRGERFAWAAALERLLAGDMVPDDAHQPEAKAVQTAIGWIQSQLAAPVEGDLVSDPSRALIKPVGGEFLPVRWGGGAAVTGPLKGALIHYDV
jgi:hypothetical protein